MDPMSIMGLVGGLGSIAGSLFGSGQQQSNQQAALQQAQLNYQLQQRQLALQQTMSQAGRTDAAGNRVYFNGKDWVTDPTAATKGIISASELNQRENEVKGGTRNQIGQENNFTNRGNVGNMADAVLREFQSGAGAPTREGVKGRNAVAAATNAGANRDNLTEAVSRQLIRNGGGGGLAGEAALRSIDTGAAKNLRTALANNDANADEAYRGQKEGYDTGIENKWNPLNAVRTNLTDAPTTPTQVGAPIDAMLQNAGNYGEATIGKTSAALNPASAGVQGAYGNISPTPYGSAFGALTDTVSSFLKRMNNGSSGGVSPALQSYSNSQSNF